MKQDRGAAALEDDVLNYLSSCLAVTHNTFTHIQICFRMHSNRSEILSRHFFNSLVLISSTFLLVASLWILNFDVKLKSFFVSYDHTENQANAETNAISFVFLRNFPLVSSEIHK